MFYIIVIALVVMFSHSIKNNGIFLEKQTTEVIKGVAMMFIIVHHILNVIGYPIGLGFIGTFGYISTGIFFFLSGYGNWISSSKTNNISIDWLKRRIIRLYVPFVLCFVAMVTLTGVLRKFIDYDLKPNRVFFDFFTFTLPGMVNWFPKVFIISIVLFYLVCKFINSDYLRIIIIALLTLIYVIICSFFLKTESFWYNSIPCFSLGCVVAKYRNRIINILVKCKDKVVIVLIIVTSIVLFAWSYASGKYYWELFRFQIVHAIIVCIVCALFTYIFRCKSKFLEYCGKNSFEIYLFHVVFWSTLKNFNINVYMYTISIYLGTFICVFMYNQVKKKFIYGYNAVIAKKSR